MTHILTRQLQGSAAWMARDFENGNSAWVHHLSASEVGIIDGALADLRSRGRSFPDFSAEDFPIGPLGGRCALAEELENGRGFLLLRGLPVERYSEDELNAVYYGIGLHLGVPVCQNPRGDLLGEVMDVGDSDRKTTRVYQTNLYLPYHSDPSDVVGLLCVRRARQGGLSSLVSVAASTTGCWPTTPSTWACTTGCGSLRTCASRSPACRRSSASTRASSVAATCASTLSSATRSAACRCHRGDRGAGPVRRRDARPGMRLDMMLEPGDLQFANNYAVLHSRNDFEDHDDPALRRRMLRLWLKMPNARALAPEFPGRNGFPPPHPADA